MNMDMIKRKLAKGLTTGAGVYASTFVGNTIESKTQFSGNGVAATQLGLGAGIAIASERLGGMAGSRVGGRESLVETGIEHFGYGIHGAGFAELADNVQTGASADRVVTVNARAQDAEDRSTSTEPASTEFSVDTA